MKYLLVVTCILVFSACSMKKESNFVTVNSQSKEDVKIEFFK